MEELAILLWTIRYRRNQIRVKNADYPISQIASTAQQTLQDFRRATLTDSSQLQAHSTTQVRWSLPPSSCLKVNFDGATLQDVGRAGLGVVIHDSQGQAVASLSEQIPLPFSSDMVEALAVAQAISFALETGCSSFILEGDSDRVIKSLSCNEDSFTPFGHILASAKALTDFSGISFSMYVGLEILLLVT